MGRACCSATAEPYVALGPIRQKTITGDLFVVIFLVYGDQGAPVVRPSRSDTPY